MQSQIAGEIEQQFEMLQTVYGLFGFDFKLKLSTRPEKYMGELETWNEAEHKKARYRLSDHIKAYYRVNRYPG